jgi:hypothetical protein
MGLIMDTRRPIILIDGRLIKPTRFGLNERFDVPYVPTEYDMPITSFSIHPRVRLECEYDIEDNCTRYQVIHANGVTVTKRGSGRRLIELTDIISERERIGW